MPSKIRVVAAMLEKDGKYLITQGRPTATLPLLWEFPGGRVEEGDSDETALARELKAEIEIEVDVGDRALHVKHSYRHHELAFPAERYKMPGRTANVKKLHDN